MSTPRKVLKESYSRLKKALQQLIKPEPKNGQPQYALQPIRIKK